MISRQEAQDILGDDKVEFASEPLAHALDALLRQFEDDFGMRRKFLLSAFMQDEPQTELRFVGAAVESTSWSYLFETKALARQHTKFPTGVQIQVPVGQAMPLVPGLPRAHEIEIRAQGWIRNKEPLGVTL